MATQVSQQLPSQNAGPGNKRKRGAADQGAGREAKAPNTNGGATEASYAALLQGIEASGIPEADDSTRTAQAALNQSAYPEPGFEDATGLPAGFDDTGATQDFQASTQALSDARTSAQGNVAGAGAGGKANVGTAEWHQQRKDNHKEVERRRREVINEGIENIAKIVPGTEKNKGAILQRTHQYIGELQGKVNGFDNERATFEIALKELTNRLDRMKERARNAWAESAKWQQRARDAGLPFDDYDDGAIATGLDDEDLNANDES
ncbi:hypothetical protein B0A52_03486 [Exophiala mesophila]|uniref:BHLH domain-containing protein n=1 Tax=Exophiala mesophila TaxID=212818 RepID=A0A438N5W8_EXOME|nr:hypothetical protein B0A52_03486 [Exophiala mesophila]